jgi:midasin
MYLYVAHSKKNSFGLKFVRNILCSLSCYYQQFQTLVNEAIETIKNPIQKELSGYVQIATWKDVNVYALKESAKRTHHHLGKFVKKFRLGLQTPFQDLLASIHDNSKSKPKHKSSSRIDALFDRLVGNFNMFLHPESKIIQINQLSNTQKCETITHLSKYFAKSKSIVSEILSDVSAQEVTVRIDEFCSELIGEMYQINMQNASIQAGTQKPKGLKSFRKKCWVDFLKGLNYVGLNSRCSQKYIKLQDPVHIYTQAGPNFSQIEKIVGAYISFNTNLEDLFSRSEMYHYRNISKLNAVRQLQSQVFVDISRLEFEKALSFLDHLMHLGLEQRNLLAELIPTLEILDLASRMIKITNIDFSLKNTKQKLLFWDENLVVIYTSIERAILIAKCIVTSDIEVAEVLSMLEKFRFMVHELISEIRNELGTNINLFSEILPKSEFSRLLERCEQFVCDFDVVLSDATRNYSSLEYLFKNLYFLTSKIRVEASDLNNEYSCSDVELYESVLGHCIENMLVSFQHFKRRSYKKLDDVVNDVENILNINAEALLSTHDDLVTPFTSSSLRKLASEMIKLVSISANLPKLSADDQMNLECQLKGLQLLLAQLNLLVMYRLYQFILFHKTMLKFTYILGNTFYAVIKNGFCVPVEEDEDNDCTTEENVSGIGIGEGDGKKDISNEIEEPEEVEGLQNDPIPESSNPDKNLQEEDNGIEMNNDFDGDLEEVDEKDNPDSADDTNQQEHDEQMGNVDQDLADAIDEQMWGDDDQQGNSANEKTEKDAEIKNKGNETEIAANEKSEKGEGQREDKQDEAQSEVNNEKEYQEKEKNDEDQELINEDDNYEENHGLDVKPANDNQMDNQEDDMDLPENMELDQDEIGNEQQEAGLNDNNETLPECVEDQEFPSFADEKTAAESENDPLPEINPENELQQAEMNDLEDENQMEESDNNEANNNTNGSEFNEANPAVDQQKEDVQSSSKNDLANQVSPAIDSVGVEGTTGLQAPNEDTADVEGAGDESRSPEEALSKNHSMTGENKFDLNQKKDEEQQKINSEASSQSNPHRSVGTALEKWKSRLRNITDGIQQQNEKNQLSEEAQGNEYEYVMEEDEDQGETQALGVADKDQLAQMDKQALVEDAENDANQLDDSMSVDAPEANSSLREDSKNIISHDLKGLNSNSELNGDFEEEMAKEKEKAFSNVKLENIEELEIVDRLNDKLDRNLSSIELADMEVEDGSEIQNYDTFRMELEKRLSEWRKNGQDSLEAQSLWRNYSSLTRDLSFHLCEQLRLILEPTLSTKLKGDYRTGKRLNMRKIISYIASQFKKDKIWMRRTKPSKRTYQIMIAMDDSLSMASSHAIQLAYESLTVITTALNQLEAGEISIVSFGEDVKLIHPFDRSWSDEAGVDTIRSFSFKQERTKVKLLMDQSLEVLRNSRIKQSVHDLWQLEIIISDGICEDHHYIRNRVHAAAEEQIAMVFIILDTRPENDSITKMTNVSYECDPLTNLSQLKLEEYMDTFPFDYYVLVRKVEDLPEILSDTLRQFFMFASA